MNVLNAGLIRVKTANGRVITVVDISKAFNTVPHTALQQCLIRKGVSETVASYIDRMYERCHTRIRAKDGAMLVELKRGVKQDYPLSLLLFNLILDPIIKRLDRRTEGIQLQEEFVGPGLRGRFCVDREG